MAESGHEDELVQGFESTDSEKEEYVDSGLPPPSPYLRRGSRPGSEMGDPMPGIPKRAVLNRVNSLPSIASTFDRLGGSLNDVALAIKDHSHLSSGDVQGAAKVTSIAPPPDVFAERKKKLQSAVMTQSMPEIRDVRALYNREIGNSLRNRSIRNTPPPSQAAMFENEVFDSLLADM